MKATLCVFVALVAVTSAAPTFMHSNRRSACSSSGWCSSTCTCGGSTSCDAATKYCTVSGSGPSYAMLQKCGNTDGTTALTADCACGATTITHIGSASAAASPAVAAAFFSPAPSPTAPGYCYFSKAAASDGAATTRASVGTCAKVTAADTKLQNTATTCTTTDPLNGCAAGKYCFNSGGKNSCALATCSNTDGTTAVSGDCACGANAAFAANGKFCRVVATIGYVSDHAKCANEDGTTAVDGACTCGYAATNVTAGANKWCRTLSTGVGKVSDTKKCSNTDGSATVDAQCTCGTATQADAATTSKYCQESAGGFGRLRHQE